MSHNKTWTTSPIIGTLLVSYKRVVDKNGTNLVVSLEKFYVEKERVGASCKKIKNCTQNQWRQHNHIKQLRKFSKSQNTWTQLLPKNFRTKHFPKMLAHINQLKKLEAKQPTIEPGGNREQNLIWVCCATSTHIRFLSS